MAKTVLSIPSCSFMKGSAPLPGKHASSSCPNGEGSGEHTVFLRLAQNP